MGQPTRMTCRSCHYPHSQNGMDGVSVIGPPLGQHATNACQSEDLREFSASVPAVGGPVGGSMRNCGEGASNALADALADGGADDSTDAHADGGLQVGMVVRIRSRSDLRGT